LPAHQGFLTSDRAVAPIGLAQSLRPLFLTDKDRNLCRSETRPRGSHATTQAHNKRCEPDPLSGFDSTLRVLPIRHRRGTPCECFCPSAALCSDYEQPTTPSEVSSPPAFSQPCGATELPCDPTTRVPLRPRGFAPPRRFAPHTISRAYSIPIPLLGFPFEALLPVRCRTSSRTPRPSEFLNDPALRAIPVRSGIEHTARSPPAGPGD
jgi:hypothetical protein